MHKLKVINHVRRHRLNTSNYLSFDDVDDDISYEYCLKLLIYEYLENIININRYQANCDVCKHRATNTMNRLKLSTNLSENIHDKSISNRPENFRNNVVDSRSKQVMLLVEVTDFDNEFPFVLA